MYVKVSMEKEKQPAPEQPKRKNRVFGYTLLSVLHAVCGLRLRVYPMNRKIGRIGNFMLSMNSLLITTSTIFCAVITGHTVFKYLHNFGHAVYIAAGFMGIIECLFRILYTWLRRRRIEDILERMQDVLHHKAITTNPKLFIKKISWGIVVIVTLLVAAFSVAMASNFISTFRELGVIMKEYQKRGGKLDEKMLTESQATIETIEAWAYLCQFFKWWPSVTLLQIYAGILYGLNFLAICRIIISDALFYSWYYILINRYSELARSLKTVLDDKNSSNDKLKEWIKFHHCLNELLKDLNALTAPVIVIAVVFTGLQICMLGYVILRLVDQINVFFLLVFGLTSVHQVFVYCILGQKIRDQVRLLHSEAYKGPWLENSQTGQHAALMICTAASEKVGLCLPGAPFFALSLEFFASMVSAVFTYFVILIQLK